MSPLFALSLAFAATGAHLDFAPSEALQAVVEEALERYPAELELPEAPELYHLRYHLVLGRSFSSRGSLGASVYANEGDYNLVGAELRLGSADFDNTGFAGWENGFGRAGLPQEPTAHSVRVALWELTDTSFKEGVEQVARKRAQVPERPEHPGDYVLSGGVTAEASYVPAFAPDGLEDLVTRLSGAWSGGPILDRGDVYVGHEAGTTWTADTEGTRVGRPLHETTVRAAAHLRTEDGELLTDQLLWTARDPASLPDEAVMKAQIVAVRDRLAATALAKPLGDEYVGPVVFEGEAATDLFRYLLTGQLEGTPTEIPFDAWFGEFGESGESVRVGRRVLPTGWEVLDDPAARPHHPGSFSHDWEGTPVQALELVTDGIVRTLAMSRTPRKGLEASNGHGKGAVGRRAVGKITMMEVDAPRQVGQARLYKTGLKAARAYGLDHVLVVRRLQVPSVQNLSKGGWSYEVDAPGALPPPIDIVRRYADGREERVRGAAFANVARFVLRDILAAGPAHSSSVMLPTDGEWADLGATEGIAGFTRAPAVVIGEMEVVPRSGDPRDVPVLPHP